jgi:hypothetical protein
VPVLVPLVEGQSEERALGVLLRRLIAAGDAPETEIARPFRVPRNKVVREGELERTVAQAVRSRSGATAVLIVLDADEDCAAELAPTLVLRGSTASQLPIGVVLPTVEIEAWILAAVESLRDVRGIRADARPPADVEGVRDAKGALTQRMTGARGYVATDDMPALFAAMDVGLAEMRSPSMAKLVREVRRLCAASTT